MLDGLGPGFDYDVVNSDVILNRISVKHGRIVFPDGMSYRVLVLPQQRDMQLEVLIKLEELVSNGATIIGPKPLDVPGMQDHESRGDTLRLLADKMWGACDGTTVKQNTYGQGKVVWGLTPQQWLEKQSIGPDFFCLDKPHVMNLDYIHRRTIDTDIYFVRNKSLEPINAWCQFRVEGPAPQLWDPSDGSIEPVFVYEKVAAGTRVLLDLAPGGSAFVVFGNNAPSHMVEPDLFQCFKNGHYILTGNKGQKKEVKVDGLPEPKLLEGVWTVDFDPKWGAPAQVILPELISWTDHESEGVKHYSGAGVYTKTLNVPGDWLASGRGVHLDLGDVRALAEVFVNGQSAGVLWKAPFMADITTLVKPGRNELKIEVMNMWINRLAGDQDLPPEERWTRTNITFDGYRGKPGTWRVQPAGLLGPVRLVPSMHVVLEPGS
jgi:hypothetical protein